MPLLKCLMADTRYYIIFDNYEQCLILHDFLDGRNIPNRIAPAPRTSGCEAACGVSLLVEEDQLQNVKKCVFEEKALYKEIFAVSGQIQPLRDEYC